MGTICILLGLIVFLGNFFLGFTAANSFKDFLVLLATNYVGITGGLTAEQLQIILIGIFGFIGLLIGLNLIMHGLTYNKVKKLARKKR